jgi:hypothetical protein
MKPVYSSSGSGSLWGDAFKAPLDVLLSKVADRTGGRLQQGVQGSHEVRPWRRWRAGLRPLGLWDPRGPPSLTARRCWCCCTTRRGWRWW